MNCKIAICDDDHAQIEYLSTLVKEWAKQAGHAVLIDTFSSAEAFLFQYDIHNDYHILLLDVEMKVVSGIDLAKQLRRNRSYAQILFVTSHVEFIGEGYEVDALHYLIKPISSEKLFFVLNKAVDRMDLPIPCITISCEGETIRLLERDIVYIESFRHNVILRTEKQTYTVKEAISTFEEKLSNQFFRCHRSYIVSLTHIQRISRTALTMSNGDSVPLARGKYDEVNRLFIEHN